MKIGDNIKQRRLQKGLSVEELAMRLGKNRATIYRYENSDIENLPISILEPLARELDTTPASLMGWENDKSEMFDYEKYGLKPVTKRKIPHLGRIACGKPIFVAQKDDEYSVVAGNVNVDFSLTAVGDSMIGANINDGDLVYIRTQPLVENGEIAAVIIDEEATLKRVYFETNKLILVSENRAYAPMIFEGDTLENIRILGKAIICQFIIK